MYYLSQGSDKIAVYAQYIGIPLRQPLKYADAVGLDLLQFSIRLYIRHPYILIQPFQYGRRVLDCQVDILSLAHTVGETVHGGGHICAPQLVMLSGIRNQVRQLPGRKVPAAVYLPVLDNPSGYTGAQHQGYCIFASCQRALPRFRQRSTLSIIFHGNGNGTPVLKQIYNAVSI